MGEISIGQPVRDKQIPAEATQFALQPLSSEEGWGRHEKRFFYPGDRNNLFNNQHINPLRIYEGKDKTFHGVWINSEIGKSSSESQFAMWGETQKEIGTENVEKVLDAMAFAYKQADELYPWRAASTGFSVRSLPRNGMLTAGQEGGTTVSFEAQAKPLLARLKAGDPAKIAEYMTYLTSDFIHERAHGEFDEMGSGPEAISQGVQFLYAPGDNPIFERVMEKAIAKSHSVLVGGDEKMSNYDLGNIVWMTEIENELHEMYPEEFPELTEDSNGNIRQLSQLPQKVKQLRAKIGESSWGTLRQRLMKKLLESGNEQTVIIGNFKQNAEKYGFERLAV